jgi:hypothetical protein
LLVARLALGALAHAQKLARQAGGDVVLAGLREPVRRLLDLTGLAGALSVYVSAAAACPASAQYAARQPAVSIAPPGRAASLSIDTG